MAKASRAGAGVTGTTDATAEFFDELGRRGHEPLLQKFTGSARFDLVHGQKTDRWHLTIEKGDVAVSRRNVAADCVMRADKTVFDRVATGELNAMAAVLRGELAVEGAWRFVVLLQRLFPGPPSSLKRTRAARTARRRS